MKGKAKAKVNAKGLAPQAAKSLKLTASALWPKPAAGVVDKNQVVVGQMVELEN
jgi:hypothetical protein